MIFEEYYVEVREEEFTHWYLDEKGDICGEVARPQLLKNGPHKGRWMGIIRQFEFDEKTQTWVTDADRSEFLPGGLSCVVIEGTFVLKQE